LAALPGRFLIAVDDGTGGAGLPASDLGLCWAAGRLSVFVAGRPAGVRLPPALAVAAVTAAARCAAGQGIGQNASRIADLPRSAQSAIRAATKADRNSAGPAGPPPDWQAGGGEARLPLGIAAAGGEAGGAAVVVAAPLGRLTAGQMALIGALLRARAIVRLAAAGRVVIPVSAGPAAALDRLAAAGLVTRDDDGLADVTACSGAACSRSVADVRALARRVPGHRRTHWAGCARQCGCPADAEPVIAVDAGHVVPPGQSRPQPVTLLPGPALRPGPELAVPR
ncbi:MAG TPA: hypothetical protein VH637_07440, partial [Streptosporangiaceae bacterium]